MDINRVLVTNYLPYAKSVIISRAFPGIDGLKPSQRRILYTMYDMGLINGGRTKSSNIVGRTMRLHPHGDSSIYDTLVRMSEGYGALNVPYIDSKGNFGKVYSDDLAYAAPRYTEAKLSKVCKEMFNGIDENAVDFVDNFDSTMLEPSLLPVAFPSILVNYSSGIAVGMSSTIPSFALKNVCEATIGMLKGDIGDVGQLMDTLGVPEFTTGGFVHATREDLIKLGRTGRANFTISGSVAVYSDRIVIYEIPYKTKSEKIMADIEKYAKSGELKEVQDVSDEIDIKGFQLVVMLKRGSNARAVLQKLCRYTDLRTTISFNTQVIINNEPRDLGVFDLLNEWIKFRIDTIRRINTFRLNKAQKYEHILVTWEKIKNEVDTVTKIIASYDEEVAKSKLKSQFDLDDTQANYLLDMRIKTIAKNNLSNKLNELDKTREEIKTYKSIVESDIEIKKIMIDELKRISSTYGTNRKTNQAEPIIEEEEVIDSNKVDDTDVTVVLTKKGYIKRLVSINSVLNFSVSDGDAELTRWNTKNNDYLLVFKYDGSVHKLLVNDIDSSRGGLKEQLYKKMNFANIKDIMFVDTAGDYSKHFNLVFPNGRGVMVPYSKASGKRMVYRSLYNECKPGEVWISLSDKFFMITRRLKAAYCDLSFDSVLFGGRCAFKVARIDGIDSIWRLQPADKVPDINAIDLKKYTKQYVVKIGTDKLF